jgi:penicillin-binding protein 1B
MVGHRVRIVVAVVLILPALLVTIPYVWFAHQIDSRLTSGPFADSVSIYASPGDQLLTTLSSKKEERLLVTYRQIPPVLVHAVVSAEDKHFFQHPGVDLPRLVKAAYIDLREGHKEQGASTLTMQLVRGLFLDRGKHWRRKVAEIMMTFHLEHEWPKEKIFETYANQVYLGRRADYAVHGFAQASRLYFGKDLNAIDLSEAALLAGLVQRPSYYNPFRYPRRARDRRNIVLALMRDNGYLSNAECEIASSQPVSTPGDPQADARAPWFLDLVGEQLQDEQYQAVWSTVDLDLQREAAEAVRIGMQEVDAIVAKKDPHSAIRPEAALIALDPHTGEIKALIGGRDYRRSQLNRVLAKRPPGSVFKPVVYAAALDTAIAGGNTLMTAATAMDDSPATFWFAGKPYQPGNFRGEQFGVLTLRQALAHSDNVVAVKVAQAIGYDRVVRMARRLGLNDSIRATPSVALGAYQVTPLEIAQAYTAFANGGVRIKPRTIAGARDSSGDNVEISAQFHQALDPRLNWLMVNLLQEVMRSGTAAGVRSRGFLLPAAGKTGTSHDGWFAGFTSRLLCVVWVGYDDYRELNIEGARSALPIWTEFMKRATRFPQWRDAKEFPMPGGITSARICSETGKLAGDQCTETRNEFFISGSEPSDTCTGHTIDSTQLISAIPD